MLVPNSACYFISHPYARVKFAELNHRFRFWPYTDCNTFIRMKICFHKTEGSSINTIWRLLFYQHIVYRSSRCIMLLCIIYYCLLEQQCLSFMACYLQWRTTMNELWNTVNCKRVFTMNKNDVFLDKVQMRNTSNCLYVCRTLDYVAKHRTGFSPPTLDEPPSWHSHYITPRALPLPYCRLASGLSSVPSFRFYSSSDSLVWILCLDSRLFSGCRSVVTVIVCFQTAPPCL